MFPNNLKPRLRNALGKNSYEISGQKVGVKLDTVRGKPIFDRMLDVKSILLDMRKLMGADCHDGKITAWNRQEFVERIEAKYDRAACMCDTRQCAGEGVLVTVLQVVRFLVVPEAGIHAELSCQRHEDLAPQSDIERRIARSTQNLALEAAHTLQSIRNSRPKERNALGT